MRTEQETTKSGLKEDQAPCSMSEKKKWSSPKVESLHVGIVTQSVGLLPGDTIDNQS